MDLGPKRDLVGELAAAVKTEGSVRFGLYYSLFEWYHPLYLQDKANNTMNYPEQKMRPEVQELVMRYEPEVVWADGDWEKMPRYWDTLNFFSWLYNDSPVKDTVITNDRWGIGVECHHGDFITCQDGYMPGEVKPYKWENAMTLDRRSWGHRRNMKLEDVLTMDELLSRLVITVSFGGNLLVNLGPGADGTIDPLFQERLRQLGSWLAVNGEAIYNTVPWTAQNDTANNNLWYTSRVDSKEGVLVYAIVLGWPEAGLVELGSAEPTENTEVSVLGFSGGNLPWTDGSGGVKMVVQLPDRAEVNSDWAFVLKLAGIAGGGNSLW